MNIEVFGINLSGWQAFVVIAIAVVVLLSITVIVIRLLTRRQRSGGIETENLAIDLNSLELQPVPKQALLEVYGLPMRLMVLVLAPAGRSVIFPSRDQLPQTVELLIPRLTSVLDHHQPIYRSWPVQLSPRGFSRSFFANLKLPGDDGKGTRWCGVVGPFDTAGGRLLAGMILLADAPNGYGQIEIEHEGHWHNVVRVQTN